MERKYPSRWSWEVSPVSLIITDYLVEKEILSTYMKDYVSKETATLLWEKGYDWPVSHILKTINWYSDKFGEEAKDPKNWSTHEEILNYNKDCVSFEQPLDNGAIKICTITPLIHLYDAHKWLQEIHNLFVEVNSVYDYENKEVNGFMFRIKDLKPEYPYSWYWDITPKVNNFKLYDKAFDEGLKTALKYI